MRRAKERGSALLVALGVLVLLSMMGVTFVILTRMERQAAANFDALIRARFLAEAGIERAMAELRDLYVGPLFGPRYRNLPPTGTPNLDVAIPYYSTVAAAESETWAARSIGLSGGVDTYTINNMTFPDPVSTESAPYLWSGPRYGQLSEGYFDARFSGEPTPVNTNAAPPEAYRVLRGVVDLSGLVNVNRANADLLEGLLTYFGIATPNVVAQNIVASRNDVGGVPQDPFRYVHELVDRGLLTMAQLYGEDANGNGRLDTGEDTNGNGVLDGALKDYITVFPVEGTITVLSSRININTAPEAVLFAVFYRVLGGDVTKAQGLARAVILYRSGGPPGDRIQGLVSEADVGELTGDGPPPDDIFSDDNPFDGVAQSDALRGLPPPGGLANGLPEFADDGIDNDGDTIPQAVVGAPVLPGAAPAFDRYLFPNGPGGFSEFEYFMDVELAGPYSFLFSTALSQADIDAVKDNATTREDIYNTATPPVTAPFRYDSEAWRITSEGVVVRGGEVVARTALGAVVRYR